MKCTRCGKTIKEKDTGHSRKTYLGVVCGKCVARYDYTPCDCCGLYFPNHVLHRVYKDDKLANFDLLCSACTLFKRKVKIMTNSICIYEKQDKE